MRKKISKFGIALVLLLSMMGCTTPSQWIADAQVDELCAKDGGIKVYETVTLPRERFNQQGYFEVPIKGYDKPTDEYYTVSETKEITKTSFNLPIYQSHYWIYRKSDQKILGEDISYWRRGGDIPLPAHPSSYGCPERSHIIEKIFLKAN